MKLARHCGLAAILFCTTFVAPFAANARGNIDKGEPGKEVRNICFANSIDGFRTIEGEDDAVLVERAVNDWYYVELMGGCSYNRLKFAQAVGIDTSPGSNCLSRGDQLIFSDSVFAPQEEIDLTRCRVSGIYEWVIPEDDEEGDEDDQGDEY